MGRRSSGGRSSSRAPARAPARSSPAPAKRASPPAPVQSSSGGSVLGAIASTIVEGVAFGGGNAVAHMVADAVMGPRTIRHEAVAPAVPEAAAAATTSSYSDACGVHYKAFQDCINSSGSDIGHCQFYMDMLSECRKGSGLAA